MKRQLARLIAGGRDPHAIDEIVETHLQHAQQVFTGNALLRRRLPVIPAELALQNSIDTAGTLFGPQLAQIV